MTEDIDIALDLDQVSRLYPRDISDAPSAILREMLLPSWLLSVPGPTSFFALRDISLRLRKGQKLGVIGTHRSGKTSLAGIASGVLRPTGGSVTAPGSRLLISRPTAGFKPTLTSLENLRLRARLAGLHGELLDAVLNRTLSHCGMDYAEAQTPMGNLSPHLVKQLGLTLLLGLPADILVVDEISSAGAGDARWVTRGLLQEKIDSSTALVISSDFNFIQEVAEESALLHHGRLYGPFSVEQAIEHFNKLPEEDFTPATITTEYDPLTPPKASDFSSGKIIIGSSNDSAFDELNGTSLDEDAQEEGPAKSKLEIKKLWTPIAELIKISVDGDSYSHTKYSLIRNTSDTLNLELVLLFKKDCTLSDFTFCLHPEFGEELAQTRVPLSQKVFLDRTVYTFNLNLEIPDIPANSYGLSVTPVEAGNKEALKDRIKVLKFGIGGKRTEHPMIKMRVSDLIIESKT